LRQQYNIAVFDGDVLVFGDEPTGPLGQSSNYVTETMTVGDQNWSLVPWQKELEGDVTFLGSSVLVLGFALSLVLGSLVWVCPQSRAGGCLCSFAGGFHQTGASPDMNSVFVSPGKPVCE
jgi:hypothetical protein